MKRITEQAAFTPIHLVLENQKEVNMLQLIATNVQPRELAEWSESVTQAEASEFLTNLHNFLARG